MMLLSLFFVEAVQPTSEVAWFYRDASNNHVKAVEAILISRDRHAQLVIRCDISGDRTLSIQYKPGDAFGIGMAPVGLDRIPSTGTSVFSKLVWEPAAGGAFARDGIDDRNASDAAADIQGRAGTLTINAADRWGDGVTTFFDSGEHREVIGQILAQCPWNPHPNARNL